MRTGVDLSEFDNAYPTGQGFAIIRIGIGTRPDAKADIWRGMANAAGDPCTAYFYVAHGVDPVAQAGFVHSAGQWAPSWCIDVEQDTTAEEGRAVIAALRRLGVGSREIIRYSPMGRAIEDGDIGQDLDWTALWGSGGRPPEAVPGIPLVAWQDWSSDSGYPRPIHAPVRGDSDVWLDESRFALCFGVPAGGSMSRFVQAYEPEKVLPVPVGTMLYTLDGKEYQPLSGKPGAVTNVRCRGLLDAHTGAYVVLISTSGLYSDGVDRLSELAVHLPGVVPV